MTGNDTTGHPAADPGGWLVAGGLCAAAGLVTVGAVWGVYGLLPAAAVGLMPWLRRRGAVGWQPVGVWPVVAAVAAVVAAATFGVDAGAALWMSAAAGGFLITAHAAHLYGSDGGWGPAPGWVSAVTVMLAASIAVYVLARGVAGPVAAGTLAASVVVAVRAVFSKDPAAQPPRTITIGVSDTGRIIAMSVNGCEPVALGAVGDDPGMLYVAAANTAVLPRRALRAALVWDVGPRPHQSRHVPFDEFRELASAVVTHTGEVMALMGDALRRLDPPDSGSPDGG